jgi:hypothetical protein
MLIKRTSAFSGITREREIEVTQEQLDQWQGGMLIQKAMPNLSNEEREFIKLGTTQAEWDIMFQEEES